MMTRIEASESRAARSDLDPVQSWHADVQENDVRAGGFSEPQRLLAVGSLGYDLGT
jgi:hypothetical protein